MSNRQATRELQEAQRAAKAAARMCPDASVELVLVRHGETSFNAEGRLQGALPPGPPLNDAGWAQAEALSRALARAGGRRFDRVYSSDLLRAVQTAGVLAAALDVPADRTHRHAGLRERDVGSHLAGLTRAEAPAAAPAAWAALGAGEPIPGGGESMAALETRLAAALEEVAARHPGERLLVVSHGGALHAVHKHSRGFLAPGRVANCSCSTLRIGPPAGVGLAKGGQRQQQQQQQQQQAAALAPEEGQPISSSCSEQLPGGARSEPASGGCCGGPRPLWALLSWNEALWVEDSSQEASRLAAGGGSFGGGANEG